MKLKVYGITYAIWGSDLKPRMYFLTPEDRERYIADQPADFAFDRLRARRMNAADLEPALRNPWNPDTIIPRAFILRNW